MVDYDLLTRELADLGAEIGPESDLHEGLHRLSLCATASLNLGGAGVTVQIPGEPTNYIAAADERTLRIERLQDELRQGACVDAIQSSEVVAVHDLSVEQRWPDYTPAVLQAGFRAVAGVPISFSGQNIGAVNLYGSDPRPWTTSDHNVGRLLAQMAAGYLINNELLRSTQTLAQQLQHALDSRVVIEQAKGVIAGRHGMTPDAAFEMLRNHARGRRTNLHDIAHDVVSGAVDPVEGDSPAQPHGDTAAT